MEKESHIQWAFYDVDHYDYYVSLNQETLEKIKEWNIIKWWINQIFKLFLYYKCQE